MSADDKMFDDVIERELFLISVSEGVPPELAGYEVKWSPAQVRRNLADPDFAMLVEAAMTRNLDELEKVLRDMAHDRHFGALQMILFNKRPGQWQDVKKIQMQTTHEIGPATIAAVRGELARALRSQGPAVLQIGGPLDGDDPDITDGEVIDDGG